MHRVLIAVVVCALAAAASAQGPQKPGAEQKKFEAFVGTWSYTGESKANPYSPAGKVNGTDVYEMLPGGFFITHHWDEVNPVGPTKGVETWGYDAEKKAYAYNYYTSLGEMGSGSIAIAGNVWTFSSSGVTYDGKRAWGKCTTTMASATRFTVSCDASQDGKTWSSGIFTGTWTKK